MSIPKPKKESISLIACVAVDVSPDMVFHIWKCARQYNSWDLATFMAVPPGKSTILAAKRVLILSGVLK